MVLNSLREIQGVYVSMEVAEKMEDDVFLDFSKSAKVSYGAVVIYGSIG